MAEVLAAEPPPGEHVHLLVDTYKGRRYDTLSAEDALKLIQANHHAFEILDTD